MQVEHKTEKGTVLFVLPPKEATGYKTIDRPCLAIEFDMKYGIDKQYVNIPEGFELIGLTSEVTEDQAKIMVDEWNDNGLIKHKHYVKDYFTHSLFTALDSFKSIMQHLQVYEVNPHIRPEYVFDYYGKSPDEFKRFEADMLEYTEAESRTGKWIVLFKPNEK